MFNYISPEFNTDFTRHLSLTIEIDVHAFTFCIYNGADVVISVIKKVTFNMHHQNVFQFEKFQAAVNTEDLLHCPFAEQHVAVSWEPFTLIPNHLFQLELADKYLDLLTTTVIESAAKSEFLPLFNAVDVFCLQHKVKYFIEKIFPKVNWHHVTAPMLMHAYNFSQKMNGNILFLEVRSGYFFATIFKDKNLLFINRFNYTNKEDFLYFVLLVCDQHKFNRNIDNLILSGEILNGSILYNELYKFFLQINFTSALEFYVLPESLDQPSHTINALLSLHLCASYQEI